MEKNENSFRPTFLDEKPLTKKQDVHFYLHRLTDISTITAFMQTLERRYDFLQQKRIYSIAPNSNILYKTKHETRKGTISKIHRKTATIETEQGTFKNIPFSNIELDVDTMEARDSKRRRSDFNEKRCISSSVSVNAPTKKRSNPWDLVTVNYPKFQFNSFFHVEEQNLSEIRIGKTRYTALYDPRYSLRNIYQTLFFRGGDPTEGDNWTIFPKRFGLFVHKKKPAIEITSFYPKEESISSHISFDSPDDLVRIVEEWESLPITFVCYSYKPDPERPNTAIRQEIHRESNSDSKSFSNSLQEFINVLFQDGYAHIMRTGQCPGDPFFAEGLRKTGKI